MKKKTIITVIAAVLIICSIVAVTVMSVCLSKRTTTLPTDVTEDPAASDIIIPKDIEQDSTAQNPTGPVQDVDEETVITPEEPDKTDGEDKKIGETATPIVPVSVIADTVEQATEPTSSEPVEPTILGGGISIIEEPEPEQSDYSCGARNHHCTSPEVHDLVCQFEQEGCKYCASHTCQSFYALDEWGQWGYDASKCPKYDIHKDPVYYCQICGKKCGDGKSGTCVQFVESCSCPNCGKHVESWTCHTCG